MTISEKDLREVFDNFDQDGSGSVDARELHHAMQVLGVRCNGNTAKKVLNKIDMDGNGSIEWAEFEKFFKKVSSKDEIKMLLSKENQRFFEYKVMVEQDAAFAKTFVVPTSVPHTKKCMGHEDGIEKVAWLSDTELISCSCDGGVCLWNHPDTRKNPRPKRRFNLDVQQTSLYSMAVNPTGEKMVVGNGASALNLGIWNISDGSLSSTFDLDASVYSCQFSMDGDQVAGGTQKGTIFVYDLNAPSKGPVSRWAAHTNVVHSITYKPSTEQGMICTASGDGHLRIFDLRATAPGGTAEPLRALEVPDAAAGGTIFKALWRGENEVISCGDDYCIKRWDLRKLADGAIASFFGHTSPVRTVELSSDDRFIVSGTVNGSVRLWLADEIGTIKEMKEEAEKELQKSKTDQAKLQQRMRNGDAFDPQEVKDAESRIKENEESVYRTQQTYQQRLMLDCTQACYGLDCPTVPISTLAWRDVGGNSVRVATGGQDPFVRIFDLDTSNFSTITPWGENSQ